MFVFVQLGSDDGLGLVLAAKSIARMEAVEKNASYYLGGTLPNFTWSIVIALAARLLVFGVPARRLRYATCLRAREMMPLNGTQQFLPGDEVPYSKAYQEHDPHTWEPVRRLLISRGDVFPPAKREGGFFTLVGAQIEKKRAAAS